MPIESRWKTFEEWKKYGIDKEFNEKNLKSLNKSKNKTERSWYYKGGNKRWLKNFEFKRKHSNLFRNFSLKQWKKYGLSYRFNQRSPSSLFESKNKDERSWYNKGKKKKWLGKFEFERKYSDCSDWQTREEWKEYGLNKGYNERNPTSFYKSKNKDERSWYDKGGNKRWLKNFEFERKKGRWKDLEFTLKQAQELMKNHNFEDFPGAYTLKRIGYSSLADVIQKYHGGFPEFREKLREYLGLPSESSQLESFLESYVNGE